MRIAYLVRVWEEDGVYSIQGLPPLDNVMTYGQTLEDALDNAREALTGVMGAMVDHGQTIPDPVDPVNISHGEGVYLVEPSPKVAVPILLRKAREAAGLTQGEVASRLGVTYQAVQKWERSGANPTIDTVDRILRAMGRRLEVDFI